MLPKPFEHKALISIPLKYCSSEHHVSERLIQPPMVGNSAPWCSGEEKQAASYLEGVFSPCSPRALHRCLGCLRFLAG